VAGLLVAGAIIGPYGLSFISNVHDIEMLAEVGVVLLLFTIGLEFSLSRLKNIMKQVALGGALQVGVTTAIIAGIALAFGQTPGVSLFYGFVFALSSTAIVLRTLDERQELDAPHGRFIVGTLIFQDLCVVPMVLIVPMLGAASAGPGAMQGLAIALVKAAGVVVLTVGLARYIVPKALELVDASRSREVFLLAILGICIGTAYLTSLAGLSLALGAFLGGMVVADTEYGHRAMGDILPMRDAFVSLFFVVLGMLFDIRVVIEQPLFVLALLMGFLVIKAGVATIAAMVMKFPARVAWLAGIGLAQFGEFGFVLVRIAQSNDVVDDAALAPLLAAGIASMFLTPLLARLAPHVTAGERMLAPLEKLMGVRAVDECDPEDVAPEGHVVIVGYGPAGEMAARALQGLGESFLVLEMNVENVRKGRAEGFPLYYGDATSEEALHHAKLETATLLVLLMNDPRAAERIVDTVRRVKPELPILMRTRYLRSRESLIKVGASDVVAEELEGGVEVVARLLRHLETPRNQIDSTIRGIRRETQTSVRKATVPRNTLAGHAGLADLKIESVLVDAGSSGEGASAASLDLRQATGALIVGVRRDDALLESFDPRMSFVVGDVVYFVGTGESNARALAMFGVIRDAHTVE
ncbi:MAG: CPA2 family monovalent cation:H+ antiporter-2, partial [Flavobacteriales bacterium]